MTRVALVAAIGMLALASACESGKPRGATTATAKVGATPSALAANASVASAA